VLNLGKEVQRERQSQRGKRKRLEKEILEHHRKGVGKTQKIGTEEVRDLSRGGTWEMFGSWGGVTVLGEARENDATKGGVDRLKKCIKERKRKTVGHKSPEVKKKPILERKKGKWSESLVKS